MFEPLGLEERERAVREEGREVKEREVVVG